MNPLETYLQDLSDVHSSGSRVKGTSYYGTLANLFNEVGKAIKPRVRCIVNIQNKGAGLPDGGFFTPDQFQKRAGLGRKIAALLDTEKSVDGVTAGAIGDPFRYVGTVSHVAGKPLDPVEDLKVTAGWGHAGKGGVTMPGKAKIIERDYSTDERKAIERSAAIVGAGLVPARVDSARTNAGGDEPRPYNPFALLGETTYDVYLNDVAYWKNIPARVWDYTIGGYQVIKKWLSYRELELLSRPLTPDEAREVMNMARRIAAIVLLEPALDANYQAVKDATYSWPG